MREKDGKRSEKERREDKSREKERRGKREKEEERGRRGGMKSDMEGSEG
jgi:hypothetical protein